MSYVAKVTAGIGLLIGMYLFLSNPDSTAKIISTFANNAIYGIRTLQGKG